MQKTTGLLPCTLRQPWVSVPSPANSHTINGRLVCQYSIFVLSNPLFYLKIQKKCSKLRKMSNFKKINDFKFQKSIVQSKVSSPCCSGSWPIAQKTHVGISTYRLNQPWGWFSETRTSTCLGPLSWLGPLVMSRRWDKNWSKPYWQAQKVTVTGQSLN